MTAQKTLQARLNNAIRIGRPARVREVMESGADALEIDLLGRTMLHVLVRPACENQDDVIEIAHLLLNAGVDINAADPEGITALTHAAYYGYTDVLRFLIQKGADANPRTPDGRTLINHLENDPIFRNRRRRIVKLLEQAGGVR
jgi:ankyrin repeat protein